MKRKRRRIKSRTLTGKRIPIELNRMAVKLQKEANIVGKRLSLQDAFRQIAREFKGGR